MDNEYLQEKVMGECWHDNLSFKQRETIDDWHCSKCGANRLHTNRDFSTPTDYCALEDKIDEEDWLRFFIWMSESEGSVGNYRASVWQRTPRTQRAALIAEYWRQKWITMT